MFESNLQIESDAYTEKGKGIATNSTFCGAPNSIAG